MTASLGAEGEDMAVDFLRKQGCSILHRNYRTPLGEADIIVMDKEAVVFVEVKARRGIAFGQPFEAVDFKKQEKLKKIALYYMKRNKFDGPVRFDVISILFRDGRGEVNHIREAF